MRYTRHVLRYIQHTCLWTQLSEKLLIPESEGKKECESTTLTADEKVGRLVRN